MAILDGIHCSRYFTENPLSKDAPKDVFLYVFTTVVEQP
jgi:hypothetical protein